MVKTNQAMNSSEEKDKVKRQEREEVERSEKARESVTIFKDDMTANCSKTKPKPAVNKYAGTC